MNHPTFILDAPECPPAAPFFPADLFPADLFYFRMRMRAEALIGVQITDPRKLFTMTHT